MEKHIYRVNFDYEHKLFHQGAAPKWSLEVNKELEYVALLWGDVQYLSNLQTYDDDYLHHLFVQGIDIPEMTQSPFTHYFWGEERDLRLEQKLNSKEMSFSLAMINGWVFPEEELVRTKSKIELQDGEVFKPLHSVSGRDFRFGPDRFLATCDGIKTTWKQRVLDISYLWNQEYGWDCYILNLNDERGQFRGCLFMDDIDNYIEKNFGLSFEDIREKTQLIKEYYHNHGAQYLQVDSFIYEQDEGFCYYPLCEVNYRKTMGGLLLKLKERLYPRSSNLLMSFGTESSVTKEWLTLSSPRNKWPLQLTESLVEMNKLLPATM